MLKFLTFCLILGGALASPWNGKSHRLQNAKASEVCYENIGCFSSEAPWTSALRPLVALPGRPEEVGTRTLLFTRENPNEPEELLSDKDLILEFSPYDGRKNTIFIIHGWTDSEATTWVKETKDLILKQQDVNVIVVDWGPGAKMSYLKAVGNTRLVGAQVARFLDFLIDKGNSSVSRTHIIGQSLGAHIAGYVGSRTPGIQRITALEPTQPYFEGTDPMCRIDASDAVFVEAVHTNANAAISLGLGMTTPVGQVDIYVNGGETQPGCKDLLGNLVTSLVDLILLDFTGAISTYACSHARVTEYWTESLKSECPFASHSCADYKNFQNGNCRSACQGAGQCTVIGFHNDKFNVPAATGKYFLNTDKQSSYCLQEARAEVSVNGDQKKISHGELSVQLRRDDGVRTEKYIISAGAINPYDILSSWIEVPTSFLPTINTRVQAILSYKRTGLIPANDPKTLVLNSLTVNFIDKDLKLQTKTFSGVTLDAGTELMIPEN